MKTLNLYPLQVGEEVEETGDLVPKMSSSKKKSRTPTSESTPNPSLPDDLIFSCFARVSRLYYPTLSLVSKSFRTLFSSPELYKTRSLLNRTESCLYVCLCFPPDPNSRWFTLCRKPNPPLTNVTEKTKNSSGYVLVPIPIPKSPAHSKGLVAVDSSIYNIGGSIENAPSSSVSILDCHSHTWHEAPSMRMERNYPAANVVDGKIYVAGGLENFDSSNWMEVFDPKTQTWEHVWIPLDKRCGNRIHHSVVIEGEIYLFGDTVASYKPKEDRWGAIGVHQNMDLGLFFLSYCVIDNVLYCYHPDGIKWYHSEQKIWRNLKGLSRLASCCVKLVDYGGKMAVLWDKYLPNSGYKSHTISCAVISLERCKNQDIWGKVEWFDDMLTVPSSYNFVGALAATL